jgi:hypothetical protein
MKPVIALPAPILQGLGSVRRYFVAQITRRATVTMARKNQS